MVSPSKALEDMDTSWRSVHRIKEEQGNEKQLVQERLCDATITFTLSEDLLDTKKKKAHHRRSFTDPSQLDFFHSSQEHAIVVIPSLDVDQTELKRAFDEQTTIVSGYEERQLYSLLYLENPNTRVVYVTSTPVNPHVVRYYLSLHGAAGTTRMSERLSRLLMLSPNDYSPLPLSSKLLSRPSMLNFIEAAVAEHDEDDEPDLSVFTGSPSTEQLASAMHAHLLEAPSCAQYWGTKQGSRELFAILDIPHPPGTPHRPRDDDLVTTGGERDEQSCFIRSTRDLALGLSRRIVLDGIRPKQWMIKLNQGFSGKGNAKLDLREIQERDYDGESSLVETMAREIEAALPHKLKLEDPHGVWESADNKIGYREEISRLGVIGEAFIEASDMVTSPSFQGFIDSKGNLRVLSTHEQLLDGQVYVGCKFPAMSDYRQMLNQYGVQIGNQLAAKGVVGHFSADFLATKRQDQWELNAIEINIRQGGTTHPFAVMELLVGGRLEEDGLYYNRSGEPRFYEATDCFHDRDLVGTDEDDLIQRIQATDIHYNPSTQRGVVFHLFQFFKTDGRIGFTAIGNSREDAHALFVVTADFLTAFGRERISRKLDLV